MPDFRFRYIPYPLWRRRWPVPGVQFVLRQLCRPFYPVAADASPPATPRQMARYLARWRLLGDRDESDAHRCLNENPASVELTRADQETLPAPDAPVRLPAQWEPVEAVIVTWPVLYPPLWALYAQLVEAIAPVAQVQICVPRPTWASGIRFYLEPREVDLSRVRFLYLPTDDIWVRDYGPFVGLDAGGKRMVVHARYNPLPNYPQTLDDAMPARWAAHLDIPARALPLYTEGGNLWSDGAGTLLMSSEFQRHDPSLTHDDLLRHLHGVFDFDKLIIVPHLVEEETGHVDLVIKLADAQTALVTAPGASINTPNLAQAAYILRHATNARGQPYHVRELPALPPYYNWGVYPIWRSYTNALTVNGRVLVPVYGEQADETALAVYSDTLPDYTIIPIDCRIVINGGGAVHCLTKEVPRATPSR
jgi:agmatine deiminase